MDREHRLDRPDREKIISLIEENTTFTKGEYSPLAGPLTSDLREMGCEPSYLADEILALIPDIEEVRTRLRAQVPNLIEEAKEQERERIIDYLRELIESSEKNEEPSIKVKMMDILQALKEEDNG